MRYAFLWPVAVAASILSLSAVAQDVPPMKNPSFQDREAWHAIIQWPQECETGFTRGLEAVPKAYGGLTFWYLQKRQYLAEVTCSVSAAQPVHLYALVDTTAGQPSAQLFQFQTLVPDAQDAPQNKVTMLLPGISHFDRKNRDLEIYTKLRPAGDCYSIADYRLESNQMALRHFSAKFECDGAPGPAKTYLGS